MVQLEQPSLDLARILGDAASSSPVARDQAADLVQDYVREQCAPTLDTIIQAVEGGNRIAPELTIQAVAASRLVDAEVTRFRDLDVRRS